jgi:FkbM family methyltransferase
MGLISNICTFKNWYRIYSVRYGVGVREFVLETRRGERFMIRPWTEDARIVKSIFAKQNYVNDFVAIPNNSVVVDVGANVGAFSIFAARWADRVFAFEPEPSNFACLRRNIELNNRRSITALNMAVTNTTGVQQFRVAKEQHSGSHSFFLEDYDEIMDVETVCLADLMERERLETIDFLKLDCEGMEIDIINGLSVAMSRRIRRIALEFHEMTAVSEEELVANMERLGYEVKKGKERGYLYARRTT